MWVFCCGMRRSGSTLQFQLAARIVEDEGIGKRIEWVRPEDFPHMREKYKDYDGVKVFKSHIFTPEMGIEFQRGNARGIYIYRDIRDAFISQQRKYKTTFELMWIQNFLASALKNYTLWTGQPDVLISRYEDVMADLPKEVQRIADHLGVKYDGVKSQSLAAEYTLERQKQRIAKTTGASLERHRQATFNGKELLHRNHIRSGESDMWRRELTRWQAALIEERARDWLVEHGYSLSSGPLSRTDRLRMGALRLASRIVRATYYRNRTR